MFADLPDDRVVHLLCGAYADVSDGRDGAVNGGVGDYGDVCTEPEGFKGKFPSHGAAGPGGEDSNVVEVFTAGSAGD